MFSKKNKKVFKVDGMHCENCAKRIEDALVATDIDKVKVNLNKKEIIVYSSKEIDNDLVKLIITNIGFNYMGEV